MSDVYRDDAVHPDTIRVFEIAYARMGIGFVRRAMLFCQFALALLFAIVGTLLARLFVPGLTPRDIAVLVALGFSIFLVDGFLAFGTIAPRLRVIEEWAQTRDPSAAVQVWQVGAQIPLAPLRWDRLLFVAVLNIGWIGVLGWLQSIPIPTLVLFVPGTLLTRLYWMGMRAMLSEQMLRPVLADISTAAGDQPIPVRVRIPVTQRMFVVTLAIAIVAGTVVAGIVGPHTVASLAIGVGVSIAVAVSIAGVLVLLLTRSVTEPVRDLMSAADRIGRGDLDTWVPVTGSDDLGVLAQSFNTMISGLRERDRIRAAFGTYLDPAIADLILTSGNEALALGQEVEVTALFLDVRGFTGYSEHRPASEVVAMLNDLFGIVVPIIGKHGGHVDKFVGDGLLAVFGAPQPHRDHADRALASALEIARTLDTRPGGPQVGIGLNSGPVVAGNIGGAGRFDFTVIGDTVNVAARVESATRLTGDAILLSEQTLERLENTNMATITARPTIPLRGKSDAVALYAASTAAESTSESG